MILHPPYSELSELTQQIQKNGYSVLVPNDVYQLSQHNEVEWQQAGDFWNNLPADKYLKDGGRYRQRRHSSFVVNQSSVTAVPHRAHWQPLSYNALHGGIDRWFEPCEPEFMNSSVLHDFLLHLGEQFNQLPTQQINKEKPWYVEVHQFRIDTTDGIGRPTPEGAHRDGVDYVAVLMLKRESIKGGETRVFESVGPQGQRFTLNEPLSLLLLDDARVVHETTPIQPIDPEGKTKAWRDSLVITFRREAFQDSPIKI
jgi:hypothetical protein